MPNSNIFETLQKNDFTAAPYDVYLQQDIFDQEIERIFYGATWHFLGFECEVVSPGDFISTYIATTPVILSRGDDSCLHAYVNRCAHRGAKVIQQLRGNVRFPTCPYHRWRYDASGKLIAVPAEKGINGKGGYPESFSKSCHNLRKIHVESFAGLVFGNLDGTSVSLQEYLGKHVLDRLQLIFGKPLRVTGYQRHSFKANWKMFVENNRDTYHGNQLHGFLNKFGIANPSEKTSVVSEMDGAHTVLTSWIDLSDDGVAQYSAQKGEYKLEDTSLVEGFAEYGGIQLTVISMFPTSLVTISRNATTIRKIIPLSPGKTNIEYTMFGYESDNEYQREIRLKHTNMLGLSGYIALEDVEVLETIQNAIAKGDSSYIEFGGRSIDDPDHFLSESTIRGFWKAYYNFMCSPVTQ